MVPLGSRPPDTVAFGPFTFDPTSGELRRRGEVVPLRPKATAVLAALIEANGRLVTRDALIERAWPNTILEAEPALHTSIRQIRRALCDSAEQPRYIETVHRRGYRFGAELRRATVTATGTRLSGRVAGLAAVAALAVAALAAVLAPRESQPDPSAVDRAAYLLTRGSRGDVREALATLEPIAEVGTGSPRMWATLAAAYLRTDRLDDADRAARQALARTPESAEAHRVLAELAMQRDRDWEEAERRFLRALNADPNNALAHNGYAYLLAITGSIEESVREARRAVALEPLSVLINGDAAVLFYWAGLHADAEQHALQTLEFEPEYAPALTYLRLAREARGDHAGARAAALRLLRTAGADAQIIDAVSGGPSRAALRAFREWAIARNEDRLSAEHPNSWVWYGLSLAEAERFDEAGAAFARAEALGATMTPMLGVDPRAAALR